MMQQASSFPYIFSCSLLDHHLCQWTIAAAPGNHALKQVLDLIVERVAQSDSTKHFADQHFVHELTGPKVFTDGVELSLPVRLTTPFESFNEWTRTWRIRLSSWVTKGDICIASQHAIRYEPKKGYSTGYVDNHLEWTTGWKRQARKFRNKLKKQAVNESISSLRPNPLPTK